ATAGVAQSVTVIAKDSSNNTVTGYAGTVHFTSSDGQAVLPANSTLSSGTGTFSVTLKTAGSQTLTATDTVIASITGTWNAITVSSAPASRFVVSGLADPSAPGPSQDLTVTAEDPFDNTADGYTGTIHFTSSDGAATLPADYGFTLGDAGSHTFT